MKEIKLNILGNTIIIKLPIKDVSVKVNDRFFTGMVILSNGVK